MPFYPSQILQGPKWWQNRGVGSYQMMSPYESTPPNTFSLFLRKVLFICQRNIRRNGLSHYSLLWLKLLSH